MIEPIISVVLAVYNGGAFLKQSVDSVLQQDFAAFELLVLDDCSTDGSYEWLQRLEDNRIKLFRNETNSGLFYNLNFLIKQSNSPLIKLWSQDDIMYPFCLSAFVNFHQQHPLIGFSYSGRDIIDEHGNIQHNETIDHTPAIISTVLHARIAYFTGSIAGNIANVCICKIALAHVGPFKEQMKISADFDMWVRLAEKHETGFIYERLIKLRNHKGQLSQNKQFYINHVVEDLEVYRYLDSYVNPELRREGRLIMREKKLPFYYTLMVKAFLKAEFSSALAYYKLLAGYTDFFKLSVHILSSKLLNRKAPLHFLNEPIVNEKASSS